MKRALAMVVLGFTVGAVAACVQPGAKRAATNKNPECPHDWDSTFMAANPQQKAKLAEPSNVVNSEATGGMSMATTSGQAAPGTWGMSLPNRISNVPEFHDCQRLRDVVGSTVSYGALAAVFARDSLASFTDSLLLAPRVLAEVFLPQGGSYTQLHITATFSCVVVQRKADGTLSGWMVPVAAEAQCQGEFKPEQLAETLALTVHAYPPPGGVRGAAFVPAVARWDWDEKTRTQFIGVRCGGSWCEVGSKDGFAGSVSYTAPGMSGQARANFEVKGWYDEQQLAEFPAGAPMAPGVNWGTLVPSDGLKDALPPEHPASGADPFAAFTGTWVHVANVYMRPDVGGYGATLNFVADAAMPPAANHATISLCRGSFFSCRPNWYSFFYRGACKPLDNGPRWYGKIEQPGKAPRYFCVAYRHHDGVTIPAVARWRWRTDDEGVWVSCPEGCCETNAEQ